MITISIGMNTLDNTFIYGLVDPRTNQLRYVGKSDSPRRRLPEHYKENHNPYMRRWLRILSANYLIPKIMILDEVPLDDWQRYEIDWIASMKAALGKRIINIHGGGTGGDTMSGRKHSPETRAKMSESAKGKPGHKMRWTATGRRHSPETIIKMQEVANKNRENRARAGRISWRKSPASRTHGAIRKDNTGESNANAKLTETQVREIFEIYQQGNITQDELGKQFNTSRTNISEIVRGNAWPHLELLKDNDAKCQILT